MDRLRDFFGELKRRNVVRVAGVYAVTAWAIFQIANTLLPVFDIPKWVLQLIAIVLMLGLPVAMVIAWAFEMHPEGVRRTQPAERPPPRFRGVDWILVAATLAIVGIFAVQALGFWTPPWRGGERGEASAAAGKSIAVLPFANFSDSKDAEYFADGLTEEVINSLAKTPDLKVAGRTSSFYYKGKNHDLRQVGRQLGVAHVLEGSIRRGGDNRIRITAQLIKVSDGFHLWSETYDRDVSDTFAVQTEIAETVAGVLKTKLLTPAAPAGAGNAEAYRLVLTARGRQRQLGAENVAAARELYQRAIKLDPNNPAAHAGYAQATMLLAQNHMALPFDQARQQSAAAIRKALALNPRSVEAHIADGLMNYMLNFRTGDVRYARLSEAAYKRALAIEPNNPDALAYYGNFLANNNRSAEAVPVLRRALETDPLNRVTLTLMANAQSGIGQIDEAIGAYRAVINLYPDYVDASENLGSLLVTYGRLDEAEPWLWRAAQSKADPSAAVQLAHLYYNLGMGDDARRVLAGVREPPIAVGLVRAINLITARDYAQLLAYTQAQYAKEKDPFWPSAIALAALHVGDNRKAIEQYQLFAPDVFGPNPEITSELDVPLGVAHALNGVGLKDQAKRILDRVIAATQSSEGERATPTSRVRRAQAYAELGDRGRALAELRQAVAEGFRSVVDFQDFVRLEDNLNFSAMRDDPQFRAIIAQIDAENAKMRAKVLARRNGGQTA